MNKYLILCVDDEREVLDSVIQDLDCFEEHFMIEPAESVQEAKQLLKELRHEDVKLALILCDHIMPQQTGIQFLIELNQDERTKAARKLLLTGQAGLEDTVEAVNHSSLDFYIAKPWQGDDLRQIVKNQLTTYIIEHETDLMPWAAALDTERVFDAMAKNRLAYGD